MSDVRMVEGTIDAISKGNYSVKIGVDWYRFSTKTQGVGFSEVAKGDFVTIEAKKAERDGFKTNWVQECQKQQSLPVDESPSEGPSKPADERQKNIAKLAVLNTAVEILKTHNKPITSENLFKVASELLDWVSQPPHD